MKKLKKRNIATIEVEKSEKLNTKALSALFGGNDNGYIYLGGDRGYGNATDYPPIPWVYDPNLDPPRYFRWVNT